MLLKKSILLTVSIFTLVKNYHWQAVLEVIHSIIFNLFPARALPSGFAVITFQLEALVVLHELQKLKT